MSFILKTFQLPYNEYLPRLICENSSSYMNKLKPLFRLEIEASEKSADISKIEAKKIFLSCKQHEATNFKT